jgi:predicted transposase YbfD/YdcC
MVSAWANQAGMSLGQVKTAAKSNEITAIPTLLRMLEIKGCIITIDAIGCQKEIVAETIEKQADYALAVKDNQKLLHEAMVDYFEEAITANNPTLCKLQLHEETDAGHGRLESRRFYLSTCLDTLPDAVRWKGLKSIGMVESERTIKGETRIERRHYICSLSDVKPFAHAVRAHWGVDCPCIGYWMSPLGKMIHAFVEVMHLKTLILFVNFPCATQKRAVIVSIKRKRFMSSLSDKFREDIVFCTLKFICACSGRLLAR